MKIHSRSTTAVIGLVVAAVVAAAYFMGRAGRAAVLTRETGAGGREPRDLTREGAAPRQLLPE